VGIPFTDETTAELIGRFHERHKEIYGRSDPQMPVTIEEVKLYAISKRRQFDMTQLELQGADSSPAFKRKREVYAADHDWFLATSCYDSDALQPGNVVTGPAII